MTTSSSETSDNHEASIIGCLLGTAVGDAIGLPYEGMSRRRCRKILRQPLQHRFLFGRGMVSDDTEHTRMIAQSIIASGTNNEQFRHEFSRRLRYWLALAPAGVGLATLRSIIGLWFGKSPDSSGVFSAGNGPSMRSAIIGATFDEPDDIIRFVRASTRITHSDPKAEYGSIAVAIAASISRKSGPVTPDKYIDLVSEVLGQEGHELLDLLRQAVKSVQRNESTEEFADHLGLQSGITGYTYHTVPVAIHAWLKHSDNFQDAITAVISCGGDTDTTAAIVGGLVGTHCGEAGIPKEWIDRLWEWPTTVKWMRRLGQQLHESVSVRRAQKPLSLFLPNVLFRNLIFLTVVLIHGFRRLLPPW